MSQTIKILSVEDDDDDAELLAFALAGAADREYRIKRARTLSEMHEVLASFRPDVVLLDMHLPDSHGLDTVRQALIASHDAPVLVLTGKTDAEIGLKAVEAGAQDFLPKPEIMTPVLKRAIDFAIQRKGVVRATELRAATDALTGLSNRAHFIRTLDTATAHADRHCHGFALAFIDLDGFKGINDSLGHAAGDEVLTTVALRMKGAARSNDHLCRLGGDEFVILLDGIVAEDQGQTAAARYAAAIEAPITLKSGEVVRVGASLGLALCPADGRTPSALVEAADQRMYQAKAARKQKRNPARKTAS
jgi:diguanylate cyclase (GGDEF)-like protein